MNAITFKGGGGRGGGGGGGGTQQQASTPTNTQDNLRSKDKVELVLGLCQGPIKGLANGAKSFYIGDTPLQNKDGSYNFTGTRLTIHPGETPGEEIKLLLGGYEDWRGVGQELGFNIPIGAITQSSEAQQIILRLEVKSLYVLTNNGADTAPHNFILGIRYRNAGGGAWTSPYGSQGISTLGKAVNGSEFHEVRVEIDSAVAGPYELEVTLKTPDSQPNAPCQIRWEGYYEVIPGQFGLTRSSTHNVTLAPSTPVVRTTDAPTTRKDGTVGIDMIDLRFVVSQLYESNVSGVFEDEIELLIESKPSSSGTWVNPFGGNVRIRGKTTSNVVFEYRFSVTPISETYDVRVTRVSGDLANRFRVIAWESTQEIVGGEVRFDGVACAQLYARASDQFSSLPDMSGDYDLLLIKVPSNYDVPTRTWTGVWNGTFKPVEEWCNNPALCLYHFAMDPVYGARKFWPELLLDKFDVEVAARWCDEPVPDGKGGWQPRYTFNGVIAEARGIKEQLRYMAGLFNATFFDDLNGTVVLRVDKDDEASALFAPENIVGDFRYSETETSTRYNDVTGKFSNPALGYESDSRRVYDTNHQAQFGVIPTEVICVGCTDPHETVRRIAYKMLTAINEKEVVSFTTNRRGLHVRPYDVILVADPDADYSVSGRVNIISKDRRTVTLRDPVYFEIGVEYEMRVEVLNPSYPATSSNPFKIVSCAIYGPFTGYTTEFTLLEALPASIPDQAVFSLGAVGASTGAPKPFRVLKVEESDGNPDQVNIEGLEIFRNKWILADNAIDRRGIDYLNFPADVAAPTNLQIRTITTQVGSEVLATAMLYWTPSIDPRVMSTKVEYRKNGALQWIHAATSPSNQASIYNLSDGLYDFRVTGLGPNGMMTSSLTLTRVAAGLNVPPPNVFDFKLALFGDTIRLSWGTIPDADFSHYRLRFNPIIGPGATWESSISLVDNVTGTSIVTPALAGTYLIKAVDTSGIESVSATTTTTAATTLGLNAIQTTTYHTAWTAGTKTNCVVDTSLLKYTTGAEAIFETNPSNDLGRVYRCRLTLELIASAERDGDVMADWASLAGVETLSGVSPDEYTVAVEISTYNGTVWSSWSLFSIGDWSGRQFKIRVRFAPKVAGVIPVLSHMKMLIDMPDRVVRGKSVIVPVGTTQTNVFLRSEEADNASWSKGAITVGVNTATIPDGSTVADKLTEDSTTAVHTLIQSSTQTVAQTWTLRAVAKAAGRDILRLGIRNSSSVGNANLAFFDLVGAGTARNVSNSGTGTGATANIDELGDGWYLCWLTGQPDTAGTVVRGDYTLVNTGTNTSYLGDGTSGIHLSNMMLKPGAGIGSYIYTQGSVVTLAAGLRINFSPPFQVVPTIGITFVGNTSVQGDYFTISEASKSGFVVRCFNSANAAVSRTIDWIAVGYGYGDV